MEGIEPGYAPSKWEWIDDVEGQPIIRTEVCLNYKCQKWHGDVPIAPLFVRDEQGFRVCPVCKASHGK